MMPSASALLREPNSRGVNLLLRRLRPTSSIALRDPAETERLFAADHEATVIDYQRFWQE